MTAVVVARPGHALREADLIAALKAEIADFKVPKRVHFVDDLPRNAMGKVQKNSLRERYSAPDRQLVSCASERTLGFPMQDAPAAADACLGAACQAGAACDEGNCRGDLRSRIAAAMRHSARRCVDRRLP